MAGPMGYRNYRGRTPKWKYVLAVVLVLVILASLAVIALQRHIVYDETGTPHLELPWQEQQERPEALGPVDITIQAPERQETVCAFTVPETPLTREGWDAVRAEYLQSDPAACNAAAVTVKDSAGRVYFDSGTAVSGSVSMAEDTGAALAELTGEESGVYAIARLSCFHDPEAANSDVDGMGLKNTGGYIFYDGNNSQWLDPGKPAARQYLCEIAVEAAALGFDEILLTNVSYPTEGKLDKIDYGEAPQAENLAAFLEELRAALEPYGAALSIEVPAGVITEGGSEAAGLVLTDIAPRVDRIYAETAPEQTGSLSAAVAAAGGSAVFVPELETRDPSVAGSCLLLK
ncbi:MAG: putative glycoside hydrolase [Oscillospiraceae bacterium]|nr:putative glycoside hydrolase [Oscillospiraceae bacterium]